VEILVDYLVGGGEVAFGFGSEGWCCHVCVHVVASRVVYLRITGVACVGVGRVEVGELDILL
jgi:hypothetical protein